MLKQFINLILFSCLAGTGIAQMPNADEIKNNNIKKVIIKNWIPGENLVHVLSYYYDENGNDTAYYEDDERRFYYEIGYNRKLKPLTASRFFPDGKIMDKTFFTYNPDGSFTSVNTDAMFGLKVTDSFDNKGHRLSHSIPDGTVIKYVYDAKGRLTNSYSIPATGDKKITRRYSYNSKGKMIASQSKGGFRTQSVYTYYSNGLLEKELTTTGSNPNPKAKTITISKYVYVF